MTDEILRAFNSALNYALDDVDSDEDRILFLRMWREGDWGGIKENFPNFDLSTVQ